MKIRVSVRTDAGRRREKNEDCYLVSKELPLLLVADGMGGHSAGEVASRMAVEVVYNWLREAHSQPTSHDSGEYVRSLSTDANLLLSAIRLANQSIYEASQEKEEYKGMGTTLAAAYPVAHTVIIAHTGDSRIYRIRGETIEMLSEDHSLVNQQIRMGLLTKAEAEASPLKNIITEALGVKETVRVDVDEWEMLEDDYYLLCTDGLTDLISDQEILETILQNSEDLDEVCTQLINLANERGGYDNITALIFNLRRVLTKPNLWYYIWEELSGLGEKFLHLLRRKQ